MQNSIPDSKTTLMYQFSKDLFIFFIWDGKALLVIYKIICGAKTINYLVSWLNSIKTKGEIT